jgi:hypothetical protein
MKRLLAAIGIAACAVTAGPHAHSAAQSTSANRWLLQAKTISKDISGLFVQDTGGSLVVQVSGKSFPDNVQPFKPFENVAVQVWLLRHDGTAQPREKRPPSTLGLSNAGSVTEIMSFGFTHSSPQDLAAVVASVNGEMFVRKIE